MLTLIPVDIAVKAIAVFGETDRLAALIQALGYDRPSEWDEDEAGEEEGAPRGARRAKDWWWMATTTTTGEAATQESTAATTATARPALLPRNSLSTRRRMAKTVSTFKTPPIPCGVDHHSTTP